MRVPRRRLGRVFVNSAKRRMTKRNVVAGEAVAVSAMSRSLTLVLLLLGILLGRTASRAYFEPAKPPRVSLLRFRGFVL